MKLGLFEPRTISFSRGQYWRQIVSAFAVGFFARALLQPWASPRLQSWAEIAVALILGIAIFASKY
jgi:hypothetical protein